MRWERRQVSWRDPAFRALFASLGAHPTAERAQDEATRLWQLLGLRSGMRVLDAGCGYGFHAQSAARRRIDVVAVDVARELLMSAHDDGLSIARISGDLEKLPLAPASFDAAYCLRLGADLLAPEAVRRVLGELGRVLRPSGMLLLTTLNAPAFDEHRTWRRDGRTFILNEKTFDRSVSLYREVELHIDTDGGVVREWVQETPRYSGDEWRALLREAGFSVEHVTGGLDGRAASGSAEVVLIGVRT